MDFKKLDELPPLFDGEEHNCDVQFPDGTIMKDGKLIQRGWIKLLVCKIHGWKAQSFSDLNSLKFKIN